MAQTAKKEKNLKPEEKLAQALVPDVEQPYRVPENWCWTRLEHLIVASKEVTEDFSDSSIKYVGLENMEKDNGIVSYNSADGIKSPKNVFSEGQILYGRLRPYLNKHDVATVGGVCSTDILVFDVKRCVLSQYVNFYFNLQLFVEYVVSNSKGINLPRVSENIVLAALCPLPPLAEQQRIVDRIESLFAKLDEAKEKARAVVDGFEDRRAAILHKAFSGELTKEWRKSEGYNIADWKHKRFSEICEIVRGGSPRPAGDPQYYDGNIPFMKVADITNNRGPYVTTTAYSIKEAGLKKTRIVEANTLLLTNSGATLGVPAICTFRTTFNDGIAAFLNLDQDSLLFFYYFWTSKTKELRAINMGAAQPNLNTAIIGAIEVDIPSVAEQKKIASELEILLNREEQAKEAAEQVIDQIDAMKKAILARAFRGDLGTNDPSEESAVELVKEILGVETPVRKRAKPVTIPKEVSSSLHSELEKKIVKLFYQRDIRILSINDIMSVSSKKFEVLESLRNLQKRNIILEQNKGYFQLVR